MLYLSTTRKWLINGSAGDGGTRSLASAARMRSKPPTRYQPLSSSLAISETHRISRRLVSWSYNVLSRNELDLPRW